MSDDQLKIKLLRNHYYVIITKLVATLERFSGSGKLNCYHYLVDTEKPLKPHFCVVT